MVSLKELVRNYICAGKEGDRLTVRRIIQEMIPMEAYPYAIAVDFDGTLCYSDYPQIIAPREDIVRSVKTLRDEFGVRIILWTCREDDDLNQALVWCKEQGLEFDAVNDNLPERKAYWNNDSRKVSANEYWDDRAVFV